MPIVFAAVDPTISQQTAKLMSLFQANQQPNSRPAPKTSTHCSPPMASSSASRGLKTPHAASVIPAPMPIVAVSVANPAMVPEAARLVPDPRCVVTPLNPDCAAELLRKYNLSSVWNHVIVGLREGFDIGIREQISRSYIFRQPLILSIRPRVHFLIHSRRTGYQLLFGGLPPRSSRATHWTIPHFPPRSGTEASYRYLPDDSGHVLSSERPKLHLCQPWHQCLRFPYSMGFVRRHSRIDPLITSWMPSSNLQHLCCLSSNTHSARPTTPLGGVGHCFAWHLRVNLGFYFSFKIEVLVHNGLCTM